MLRTTPVPKARPALNSSWSLVELLVVMATIAILAGLLLPSLSRARITADKVICINNERQIGLALSAFLGDQGFYPRELGLIDDVLPNPLPTGSQFWAYQLEPYVSSKWPTNNMVGNGRFSAVGGLFACPGFTRLPGFYSNPPRGLWFAGGNLEASGAYAYNDRGATAARGLACVVSADIESGSKPVAERLVLNPSDMIAVTDSLLSKLDWQGTPPVDPGTVGNGFSGQTSVFGGWWRGSFPFTQDDMHEAEAVKAYLKRHGGRFNVLFCDGHTEITRANLLFSDEDENKKRWNRDNQP